MLNPIYPKTFRKQYKLMEKRGMAVDKLLETMHMIISEQPLPPERSNHPLHGEWEGAFDCHIQGNWVLIYEIDSAACTVTFHRTGLSFRFIVCEGFNTQEPAFAGEL